MIAPKIALLVAQPANAGDSANSRDRKGRAPEIITRSYPNKNPPAEATNATPATYRKL